MTARSAGPGPRKRSPFERLGSMARAVVRQLAVGRGIPLFGGKVPISALAAVSVFLAVFLLAYLFLWGLLGVVGLTVGWIAAFFLGLIAAGLVGVLNLALTVWSSRRGAPSPPANLGLRFLADVAIVGGLLLVVEAGVTLLWQEPLSAFLAARAQAGLESELRQSKGLAREDAAELEGRPRQELAALAARHRRRTEAGDALGKIRIPSIDSSFSIVEGTDTESLRKGPGHYPNTALPGERNTVGLAGHRTTYLAPFREIDELERGDAIVVRMPYGRFAYTVKRTKVVDPSHVSVLDPANHGRIVLTACHPLYSAEQRIVVTGRVSRVQVVAGTNEG
jgi:sortase A